MSIQDAEVRRPARVGSDTRRIGLSEFGQVGVDLYLPPYARLAYTGKLFAFDTSAGTAKAPVVAAPTTSPEWALYNASKSHCLVVLEVACTMKSGTQGLGLAIMGAAAIGAQTAVTSDYTAAIKSCLDGSARKPDAYVTNNPTLVGGTPSWHVYAADNGNIIAQANIGSGLVANIDGKLVARPNGGMVAFEVFGPTGTNALYVFSAVVAMIEADYF